MDEITRELQILEALEEADQVGSYALFWNLNDEDKPRGGPLFALKGNWYTDFTRSLFPEPMPASDIKRICESYRMKYTLYGQVHDKQLDKWKVTLDTNQFRFRKN